MAIDKKLIDQLLTDYKKPEDIIGENGLLKELTKAILERALAAEMTDHLGYEKDDAAGHHRGNSRNGKSHRIPLGQSLGSTLGWIPGEYCLCRKDRGC
jgi:putative transposase